jgi:hypothetical protein
MDDHADTDVSSSSQGACSGTEPKTQADFDRRMLELAGQQHFVVTREQLLRFGSRRQVEHRLKKRVLEGVHEAVYRVAGSPETWHQQLQAACLASSGASVVSFRAAAQLWRLPGGSEIVEITSPRHRRVQCEGVRTHESRFLTDADITYMHGLRVTRPARLICDLALLVARGELRPSTP